ncbi:unnamed protein product [Closterium sp. NIES-53]
MYAVSISAEGDCYLCVPPNPGIEAAALGASESAAPGAGEAALSGTASAQVLHIFTLDSGASRSFFRNCITLSQLSRPVAVSLADPSGGPVLAHSSTVLPCLAVPSGSLSGLHLPSFSTNLVSGADLQDAWVDQFTPGGQRVTHCSCTRTGRHLATFTRLLGSSLYTLTTVSPPVAESGQVTASGQVFAAASRSGPESAPCSCRLLSHQTLLWHHRLGHPSLPRLRGMASRVLVTGLPRYLPPLPPGPAPTCGPCVKGRQRAAPHSSKFPPTEASLQTLHMDVWGPARVHGQGHERYFVLVIDDYSRYTTVFPLRRKGDVTEVLIDWICAACRQLSKSFGSDLPVLHLHSDRGGEFSSNLLRAFCRAEGIRQTFTLPASAQQNRIAERRISMVMDVACTFMIHAAAPHFVWPFAVQYATHQINLQPRVSMPETTPTLRWTGKVGDASAFRVWGSRAFVRDLSSDKLSSRAVPCVFIGFPPNAPGWQFHHPTSRRVLSSQDVMFDESVLYYYAIEPVKVAVDSGAARGVEPERAEPGGAESRGAEPGVAKSGGAEPEGAEPARVESGGAAPRAGGATGAGGSTAAGAAGGSGVTGPGGSRTGGTGAAGPGGATGAGAARGAGAGGTARAGAAGGTGAGATGAAEASGGSAGAGGAARAGAPGGARVGATGAAGGATGAAGGATGAAGAMDAEMASWKSTGTYVDEVPPPGAKIVDGMWIFRTSPTLKITTLRVLLHVAAQRDYELHSLDFSTAFLQGSLQEEIWLRCPPRFIGSFPPGTQWSLRRPVYGLRQAPREWQDILRTTLAALGFAPSTAHPSLFLRTDTTLPLFYILVYVDDLVFATAGLAQVKSELQKRHTCTDLGEVRSYLGLHITWDRARRTITLTQSHMVHQVLQRFNFMYSSP